MSGPLNKYAEGGSVEAEPKPQYDVQAMLKNLGYGNGKLGDMGGANLPLLMAGARMMTSKSPFALGAVGEGLEGYGTGLLEQRKQSFENEANKQALLKGAVENLNSINAYNIAANLYGNAPISGLGSAAPGGGGPSPAAPGGTSPAMPGVGGFAGGTILPGSTQGRVGGMGSLLPADATPLQRRQFETAMYLSGNPAFKTTSEKLAALATEGTIERLKMLGTKGIDVIGHYSDGRPILGIDPSMAASQAELKAAEQGFLMGADGRPVDTLGPSLAARKGMEAGAEARGREGSDKVEVIDNDRNSPTFGQTVTKRARDIPGMAAGYSAPAPAPSAGMGGGAEPPKPSAAPRPQAGAVTKLGPADEAKVAENKELTKGWGETYQLATVGGARESLYDMGRNFSKIRSGAWTGVSAELAAKLQRMGVPNADKLLIPGDKSEAEDLVARVQEIEKQATSTSFSAVRELTSRPAVAEVQMALRAFANPNIQPDAAKKILSVALAKLDMQTDLYNYWHSKGAGVGNADTVLHEFAQTHKFKDYVDRAAKELPAFMGERGMHTGGERPASGGVQYTPEQIEQARKLLEARRAQQGVGNGD